MFEHLFENIIIEHYPLVNVKTVNASMWSFLSLSKFIFRGASRLRLVPFQVPDGHMQLLAFVLDSACLQVFSRLSLPIDNL